MQAPRSSLPSRHNAGVIVRQFIYKGNKEYDYQYIFRSTCNQVKSEIRSLINVKYP